MSNKDGFSPARFTSKPDPLFLCLSCKKVVNSPRECMHCQNLLCFKCSYNLSNCPSGCTVFHLRRPAKFIEEFCANLELSCSFCSEVLRLSQIEVHESQCPYQAARCVNPACDHKTQSAACSIECRLLLSYKNSQSKQEKLANFAETLQRARRLLYDEARDSVSYLYSDLESFKASISSALRRKNSLFAALDCVRIHI